MNATDVRIAEACSLIGVDIDELLSALSYQQLAVVAQPDCHCQADGRHR